MYSCSRSYHGFQFTPLREGRLLRPRVCDRETHFNSRPSARGDGKQIVTDFNAGVFQFTPLREGRRWKALNCPPSSAFQFTPLREGRRQKICNFCKSFVQPLQISMA